MTEPDMLNTALTAAGGSGVAIAATYLYVKGRLSDMQTEVERLRHERDECASKCERRFSEGNREFKEIIGGINEIKVQVARIESKDRLAQDIASELASLHRRSGEASMELEYK